MVIDSGRGTTRANDAQGTPTQSHMSPSRLVYQGKSRRGCSAPQRLVRVLRLLFITLKPRVEWYTKSMSLKYEPASEPLHISVKQLFSNYQPNLPHITASDSRSMELCMSSSRMKTEACVVWEG